MIVVETLLKEIFSQLPQVPDSSDKLFKPKFNWGSQNALNLFIATTKEKYPLIWLVESEEKAILYPENVERTVRLILAKNSNHITNTNPIIWDTEYTKTLNPLLDYVLRALESSGATNIVGGTYTANRISNYSEETKKNKTADVWNVIVFEAKVRFTKNCINQIKFT